MKKEFAIVRTYHRDSHNPYPGRLESEKRVEISKERRAWLAFLRKRQAERNELERAQWDRLSEQFEKLVDQAVGK